MIKLTVHNVHVEQKMTKAEMCKYTTKRTQTVMSAYVKLIQLRAGH